MSPSPKIKAVNLGGWLVTEGWIKPSLFDGIPNKDFLDGTRVQFKSAKTGKYLCAEDGGGGAIVADRPAASTWETFTVMRVDESTFNFVVLKGQFIGRNILEGGDVVADAIKPLSWEEFSIIRSPCNRNLVRIKASNGLYWQVRSETSVTADSKGDGSWGGDDPSVFVMTTVGQMRGEFQVTNGYGRDHAAASILDGAQVRFKSATTGKYLCADKGGGSTILANKASSPSDWETFQVLRADESTFNFLVFNRQFIGRTTQEGGAVIAKAAMPFSWEQFSIIPNPNNRNLVRVKASNGRYWQVKSETSVTVDSLGDGDWGKDDPSVFSMMLLRQMRGQFQLATDTTYAYWPDVAADIMREHWNTFIVEDDFRYISEKGLNAVRIPVGWWIATDPSPPRPFVGGSLQTLDKAFSWAEKYGLGVIIDLHAAPGAQNGDEHGGSRDGTQTWGQNDIKRTVAVIDFLASRYAKSPSLLAMELMNEPRAPGISLDTLSWYYHAAYDAVRKHTSTAYVIVSSRLGPSGDPGEILSSVRGLSRVAVDVHCYNLFEPKFDNMSVQQNIDFVNKECADLIKKLDVPDGPLVFIGEWAAEWRVQSASNEDYQRFATAQLDVFGKASFGWAYWTYKNINHHWSLKWMIDNGFIAP